MAGTTHRGSFGGRQVTGWTALAAAVVLAAFLAIPGAAGARERALYSADGVPGGAGSISQFLLKVPGGGASPLGPPSVATAADPQHIAITSNGRFAYAGGSDVGEIYSYRVRKNGTLKPLPVPPAPAEPGTHGVVVTPDGSFAYAANASTGNVSQYEIADSGALVPLDPPLVHSGDGATGVAVSPDGGNVYVTNMDERTVSQFTIGKSGALNPLAPDRVKAPHLPSGVGVHPNGKFLYVGAIPGRIAQYRIDRGNGGTLEPLRPLSVSSGRGAAGIAIPLGGRYLYTPDAGSDSASQFRISKRGRLLPLDPPSLPAGARPEGIAPSADGRSVYLANADDATISHFKVTRSGALRERPVIPTGESPHGLATTPNQGPKAALRVRTKRRAVKRGSIKVRAGEPLRLNASGSRDPDGSVATYTWRFGDGTVRKQRKAKTKYRYEKPGRYRVRLIVTDNERCGRHLVYTGQTTSCNGGPRAVKQRTVRVRR